MFAALAAVPFLMHYLGQERLGVLSLVWVIVGYFSFLDMGLGRAVTVTVASCRHGGELGRVDELHVVGTAAVLLVCVGSAMALLVGLGIAVWGVPVRLSSPAFLEEVKQALLWMLPSLPLLLVSSALRGHLEGAGAFRSLNLLRIPTGVMLVAGPCLTALYSPDLVWACASILAVRLVHVFVLLWLVAREMGFRFRDFARALVRASGVAWLRQLLSFGGWVTVSNIVGPVIVYVDRFVIGAVLAASSVVIYAVPFDVVSRLPVLVASLCSVLLPELARLSRSVSNEPGNIHLLRRLVRRSSMFSAWVVAAVVVIGWVATPWALRWWVGAAFEEQATQITQLLLLAFGVNALAQIPFTALQAAGRVRAVALLHMAELVPYGAVVFLAISWLGIAGAAWAWLLRSVIDYAVLAWMWHRHSARLKAGITV
ncbi:Membrane protein involved in the export of O-antigen and teichoic acid [Polaromonas sp. OV174]|nr:Membrane protein involved in the export of O-antigen and teichoic acid [Polaromonas sp. OV174]